MKRALLIGALALGLILVAGLGAGAALFFTHYSVASAQSDGPIVEVAPPDVFAAAPWMESLAEGDLPDLKAMVAGWGPFGNDIFLGGAEPKAEPGVLVGAIVEGSAFDTAGIARGDVILSVNGKALEAGNGLHAVVKEELGDLKPGDRLVLSVRHGDQTKTVTVTAGDHDGKPVLGFVPAGVGLGAHRMVVAVAGVRVQPDGPAAKAGMQDGDRIVSVDGQAIDKDTSLAELIATHKPGDKVSVVVERDGSQQTLNVTLGAHPDDDSRAYLGVGGGVKPFRFHPGFGPLVPGLGNVQGAAVMDVTADSPADEAGLKRGEVVTAIDGKKLDSPQVLVDAVAGHKPGDAVKLTVRGTDGKDREIQATLDADPDDASKAHLGLAYAFVDVRSLEDGRPARAPFGWRRGFRAPWVDEAPVPAPEPSTTGDSSA